MDIAAHSPSCTTMSKSFACNSPFGVSTCLRDDLQREARAVAGQQQVIGQGRERRDRRRRSSRATTPVVAQAACANSKQSAHREFCTRSTVRTERRSMQCLLLAATRRLQLPGACRRPASCSWHGAPPRVRLPRASRNRSAATVTFAWRASARAGCCVESGLARPASICSKAMLSDSDCASHRRRTLLHGLFPTPRSMACRCEASCSSPDSAASSSVSCRAAALHPAVPRSVPLQRRRRADCALLYLRRCCDQRWSQSTLACLTARRSSATSQRVRAPICTLRPPKVSSSSGSSAAKFLPAPVVFACPIAASLRLDADGTQGLAASRASPEQLAAPLQRRCRCRARGPTRPKRRDEVRRSQRTASCRRLVRRSQWRCHALPQQDLSCPSRLFDLQPHDFAPGAAATRSATRLGPASVCDWQRGATCPLHRAPIGRPPDEAASAWPSRRCSRAACLAPAIRCRRHALPQHRSVRWLQVVDACRVRVSLGAAAACSPQSTACRLVLQFDTSLLTGGRC